MKVMKMCNLCTRCVRQYIFCTCVYFDSACRITIDPAGYHTRQAYRTNYLRILYNTYSMFVSMSLRRFTSVLRAKHTDVNLGCIQQDQNSSTEHFMLFENVTVTQIAQNDTSLFSKPNVHPCVYKSPNWTLCRARLIHYKSSHIIPLISSHLFLDFQASSSRQKLLPNSVASSRISRSTNHHILFHSIIPETFYQQ